MKYIKLFGAKANGLKVIVDDNQYKNLNVYKWYLGNMGYAVAYDKSGKNTKNTIYMHRLIITIPAGMTADHINRNKLDNRASNLRACTIRENQFNTGPRGDSGYKGVHLSKHSSGKFLSRIYPKINGKKTTVHLGTFSNPIAAAKAYDIAATQYFGEYAYLNFPVLQ